MDLTRLPRDVTILIKEFVLDEVLLRRLPHPPLHHGHIQKLLETTSNVPRLLYTLYRSRREAVARICDDVSSQYHFYWEFYIPPDRYIRLLYTSKVKVPLHYALCDLNTQKHALLCTQPRSNVIFSYDVGEVPQIWGSDNGFVITIVSGSFTNLIDLYPRLSELQFTFLLSHYQHFGRGNFGHTISNEDFMRTLIDLFTPLQAWNRACIVAAMVPVLGYGIAATIHGIFKIK